LSDEYILRAVEIIVGENGRKIMERLLLTQQGKSDEELAQELNMKVNDVRRILYELAKYGFVSYIRTTKGDSRWYNFYWYTDKSMSNRAIIQRIKEIIRILQERLEYEKSEAFYLCPNDNTRYTFEEAFENNFRCLSCGGELIEVDNNKVVSHLLELIRRLQTIVNEYEQSKRS